MNGGLQRNLRRLSRLSAVDTADRALRRSCIGRLVGMLTTLFVLLCIAVWLVAFVLANRIGIIDRFSGTIGTVLGVALLAGFVLAIVLAGLIGNWLRRRIWSILLTRRFRR